MILFHYFPLVIFKNEFLIVCEYVYLYNVYNNQNNIDINIISLRKTTFVITDKRKNALKYELKV